ncbi:MAG: polyprenyl diphosphate synthase [Minisyncoccales bacterium]
MSKKNNLKIPKHVGIILDGNRRWAKKNNLPSFKGHNEGRKKAMKVIRWAKEKGVKILTLFVFSTENWKRSDKEVGHIMKLGKKALSKRNIKKFVKNGIKVKVIGKKDRLSSSLKSIIQKAEEKTKNNTEMTLNIALSYGGRAEIVEAFKKIIKKDINPEDIDEDLIAKNLWTSDLDLIIRTGKEKRLSNFFIWQAAYSELCFLDKYWPEFEEKDLDKAIKDYSNRQRRFGE